MLGRVVPFEALDEAARLGGGEGLVERSRFVGVEIVLHQHDFRCVGEARVGEIFQNLGVIDGGVTVGDFDVIKAIAEQSSVRQPSSGANSMNRLATPLRSYS